MKHDKHHRNKFHLMVNDLADPADPQDRKPLDARLLNTAPAAHQTPQSSGLAANQNLLDELQSLLNRLGAAKIILTLYLIEFGGLPERLARPLLAEAAGSCAMLRLPSPGRHLVIYLGPEPSLEAGGILGRLRRGLAGLLPPQLPPDLQECAWAEVRSLRRCNHDIAAPAYLLLDLSAAAPRVLGITDW